MRRNVVISRAETPSTVVDATAELLGVERTTGVGSVGWSGVAWNLPATLNVQQSGSIGLRQYALNAGAHTISVSGLPAGVTYNSGTESLEGASTGTASGTATFTLSLAGQPDVVDTATVALVDAAEPLFFDDFGYELNRVQGSATKNSIVQARGWWFLSDSNTVADKRGYIYTVDAPPNYVGNLPNPSARCLAIEMLGSGGSPGGIGQEDVFLQYGRGEAAPNREEVPGNVWFQFWIYNYWESGVFESGYNNQDKFIYPTLSGYPAHPNWLFHGSNQNSFIPHFNASADNSTYYPFNQLFGSNMAGLESWDQSRYGPSPAPNGEIGRNEWVCIRFHVDTSGPQGTYEQWIRKLGEPSFTKVAEYIGGVTPGFTWGIPDTGGTFGPVRGGHTAFRVPVNNSSPYRNSLRYMQDFAMATSESDLPVYP